MRFYPCEDVDFYVEYPNALQRYCKHPKSYKWTYGKSVPTDYINYWGDVQGSKKHVFDFTIQDLWVPSHGYRRTRETACLPQLYSLGERYIKLEQAPPNGFKCSPLPMNLAEARVVTARIKEEPKKKQAAQKAAKKAEKAAKKAAQKDAKKKGSRTK